MTYDEMKSGFLEGRTLIQEEWSTDTEKAALDKLGSEGACTISKWEYRTNFQCEVRFGTPIIAGKKGSRFYGDEEQRN